MNDYKLIVTPSRPGFSTDRSRDLDVLIRLQAPERPQDPDAARRHRLNLAFVIDRSGSMAGRPLEEAKRCVALMIESLRPDDRAACVLYDNNVEVVVPSIRVIEPGLFRRALAGVHHGGSTNLHGGWLEGAKLVADALSQEPNELARVILLSDGCANVGLTDPDTISDQCAQLASANVSTSTYGLGHRFNEDLMVSMARSGGGNHYYGETADDLFEPFKEEFDLLRDLCARRVQLHVKPAQGVSVRLLNDYKALGTYAWLLPDIAYGSEAWAVLRISVEALPSDHTALERHLRLLEVFAEFQETDVNAPQKLETALRLPLLTEAALESLPIDEIVAARVKELEAAELQLRIRGAALRGDWDLVDNLIAEALRRGDGHEWVSEIVRSVREYVVCSPRLVPE